MDKAIDALTKAVQNLKRGQYEQTKVLKLIQERLLGEPHRHGSQRSGVGPGPAQGNSMHRVTYYQQARTNGQGHQNNAPRQRVSDFQEDGRQTSQATRSGDRRSHGNFNQSTRQLDIET